MTRIESQEEIRRMFQQAERLFRERRLAEAEQLCRDLVTDHPELLEGWMLLGRICQSKADFSGMLEMARRALMLNPGHPTVRLQEIDALIHCGRIDAALECLERLEKESLSGGKDVPPPMMLQHLAEFYTMCHAYEKAESCYRRAVEAEPDNAKFLYNLASAVIAVGRMEEAEQLLNRVLRLNPRDYDAYYNRSTLRRQTADNNHVAEIRAALGAENLLPMAEVQLCYALAKELEDLGKYEDSFHYLKRGADLRRQHMSYKVEEDVETINHIMDCFDDAFFARSGSAGHSDDTPIFIIGLPRSGTTLVDRILSSHSDVESLGEVNHFALALMQAAGPARNKRELVEKSTELDFAELGRQYCDSLRGHGRAAPHLIDKTPMNFLYVGLIARALLGAKVIHLQRHPLDSCYAMYKTLFRMGYPFSYDLADLGRYYLTYAKLMDHWRRVLPDFFLDVAYEDLVDDQEGVSRRIIEFCGLDWQPQCLEFYRNMSPSATASAAQVRKPIYKTSLARWRSYEKQLAPLKEQLEQGGIRL
ncbi:tetratricopeptide repeat-containing sulfotransferase family protein [Luteithermobacter gelatinilyticus]|uniref:tetratricopeptide repeat-containing sulfotransferase family protein n=1 Tax=Luteithermobacter gelatinilyticus TaxID=2582913 RepID=UPI001107360B|nr:tetratricopeptide repeat-containing sulfotransferase family protein [Luteithermobacter gelatinilyticus]